VACKIRRASTALSFAFRLAAMPASVVVLLGFGLVAE
jgi:hypothetical protein